MNRQTAQFNPDIYQNLFESGKQLLAEKHMDKLLDMALNMAMKISGGDRGWICLFKESAQDIEFQVMLNLQKSETEAASFKFSKLIIENVITGGIPVFLPDPAHPSSREVAADRAHARLYSLICIPLKTGKHPFGILYLDQKHASEPFTQEIFELVQEYAKFISTAIHALKEQEQLRSLISGFGKPVENGD